METIELKQVMADYNHKLDELIHVNKDAAIKSIQQKKTKRNTSFLLLNRVFELISFGFIMLFMGNFVVRHWGEIHLVISGLILELFAIIAFIGSIGQIILISQIDFSKPVIEIRKKIEMVNAHGFLFLKLILLSIPVWWIYPIIGFYLFTGVDIFSHLSTGFVRTYLITNGLLAIPLIWFFNKLSYKNLHIKWVRITINRLISTQTRKALEFLQNVEAFER